MLIDLRLGCAVSRIGIEKDLHEIKNYIYYVNIKNEPIIPLTQKFFSALRLFDKLKDAQLGSFLFSTEIKNRLSDAFSSKNLIDGRIMQRELNSNQMFADDYIYFNKVYQKLSKYQRIK